jgi:NAD(P)-dependent dehydrogenase (short-subunit alcohol dehydrogenase family)
VAYRGGHRWVQGYEKLAPGTTQSGILRDGGTYLITGGLGEVGLALAETIARAARANLVLVGRSQIPERHHWPARLAGNGQREPLSRKLVRIKELERLGAQVLPVSADVCDAAQLRAVINQARAKFGRLHGVIHAAGATEADAFGPANNVAVAACERHFGPKVDGLRILDAALAEERLDFCVLVSSLSACLGGLGFVAYAAANAYLDVYAASRAREGLRCMSINWDGWAFNGDLGNGRLALTRSEGMDVFRRLLSLPLAVFPAQLAVSTGDLNQRIDQWIRLSSVRRNPLLRRNSVMATHQRPVLDDEYEAPVGEVERFVSTWQSLRELTRSAGTTTSSTRRPLSACRSGGIASPRHVSGGCFSARLRSTTVSRLAEVISDALAPKPTEGLAEFFVRWKIVR